MSDQRGSNDSVFAQIVPECEQLAQSCASRIIVSHQDVEKPEDNDVREVDLDSLEISRPRSVGAEHVTLEALRLMAFAEWQTLHNYDNIQTSD